VRYARAELPTPGLYTTVGRDGMKENFHTVYEKSAFATSRLKSVRGHRIVLTATCWAVLPEKTGRRGGRLSPVFLKRKVREEHAVGLSLP
jgi:hypothetical protein